MTCLIRPKKIKARCPYCANILFQVKCPGEDIDDEQIKISIPKELECLPYTRDIGIFDPEDEADCGKWTKIGSDFHSTILGWERIGILRTELGQKVCYLVVQCPQCKHLFEVYANYTPKRSFAEMWPHLFEKGQDDDIKQYEGITLTQRIIGNRSLTPWFVCFTFAISFIPDIADQWQTIKVAGGGERFLTLNWARLLTRGIGCLILLCILLISFSFIQYLKGGNGFEKLFKIRNKRVLAYWRNYTRARFVGVQKERIFCVNQVMITAGIPTVVVLLLVWISYQAIRASIWPLILYISLLLVPFSYVSAASLLNLYVILKSFVKSFRNADSRKPAPEISSHQAVSVNTGRKTYQKVVRLFFPIKEIGVLGSITGLFVIMVYLMILIYQNQSLTYVAITLFELCFWIIISYYIGIGTWNILEIPIYILKGVKKIPMNLDPLDHFANLIVLERLSQISIIGMVILFILTLLLSICQSFAPIAQRSEWIVVWSQAAFIGLYVAIAIILKDIPGRRLILIAISYILLQTGLGSVTSPGLLTQIFPSLKYLPFGGPLPLYQYLSLVLFGSFSSYIFYLQFREINGALRFLREKYKKQKRQYYQELVNDIEIQLHEMDKYPDKAEKIASRKNLLESISVTMDIIDKIDREPVDILGYRQITGIISPLVSSIVIPIIINYLSP